MKTKSLLNKFSSKGFTLIELLIVIAILGILAAATLVAINPVKRINQAKDSVIKSDIGQIASAMQAYYASIGTAGTIPYYPSAVSTLASPTVAELKTEPLPERGGVYDVACGTPVTGGCTDVAVSEPLFDSTTNEVWCWKSSTGASIKTTSCTP